MAVEQMFVEKRIYAELIFSGPGTTVSPESHGIELNSHSEI